MVEDEAKAMARADEALAALRASGTVRPAGPFTADELDAWPVALPTAVRRVLLETGGVVIGGPEGPRGDVYRYGPAAEYASRAFRDGYWELGERRDDDLRVIVGVDGAGRADWGPVLAASFGEDGEVWVLAPTFTDWLSGLAGLPPSGAGGFGATVTSSVAAVPSVAVAEGPDSELAALVGRGDQLTDVVDLAALPGYPCRVSWEPYYSLEFNTADTGSSEVEAAISGGGRLLLLRSVVSGDFLGRPVRRHTVPADAAAQAVTRLRALAVEFPDRVALAPGCPDDEMDRWPVPVPADVRGVLREIGAVRISGLPDLLLLPGAKEHEVAPETHAMLGGDGTYWPLAQVGYGPYTALAQIRLDPATGAWGCAVSVMSTPDTLREFPDLTLIAESLPDLLLTYARLARQAADRERSGAGWRPEAHWLFPNTGEAWPRPVPVEEWAGSADPLLTAAAELPPGSHGVDLREVPVPADICFHRAEDWPYRHPLKRLTFPGAGTLVLAELEER
ncbi:hypothetical protein J7E93_34725 [Streptomyces sp. ISL-36]|uniref:SMI1/KNR4 family protein n=1 Tax=Streptomyces sp. ISL-36 TaxID=2819182 RepID=UPI001BE654AC|nr:SMI1/KNR4 family protein [Streptomyces sp. ISL-36]MBT2445151.1 hypothetical protein [Streptomyces sp. ISL-36]